ncbi:MAG: heterodisulfide reductase-related iron-sulfur binding cluster [Gemmataceae bacterium]|nr:heterodisulfide reductase-related iron-sulfur binding cluster [Gemmataceae bacterium]MDW8266119.1 heterodisulfide reductase-related iron-sulfur binding cluster [Gemmataceae bacterium]
MATIAEPARTSLPVVPPSPRNTGIDYELLLDCVHCGLCTAACPTYVELGTEMDSPRGRIYLMRAVTDGRLDLQADVRRHLDLCLDCRACESACPSGVRYGRLIEPFRLYMKKTQGNEPGPIDRLSRLQRWALFHVTPYAERLWLALAPARLLQRTGLDRLLERSGLLDWLPPPLRQLYDMLPRWRRYRGRLPEFLPAHGKKQKVVALFTGCAGAAFFPETNWNTARVLQRLGCDVWVPRGQVCCGALHYHAAEEVKARAFAAINCAVFGQRTVDAIIVNAAGCGAMLKDYAHVLGPTAHAAAGRALARKVRDISEFLVDLKPQRPTHPVKLRAVYHDPCHLCHAQQVRSQPRQLLEWVPELTLVPLDESEICCGAAGSYNLTQPEMAQRLGERKVRHILATGAEAVFTANVGCLLQIGRYLRPCRPEVRVAHPIDVLWASYSGEAW